LLREFNSKKFGEIRLWFESAVDIDQHYVVFMHFTYL